LEEVLRECGRLKKENEKLNYVVGDKEVEIKNLKKEILDMDQGNGEYGLDLILGLRRKERRMSN
jgi:hypothetical protein